MCILGSVAPHSNESVVPQSPADLSDDDHQLLKEFGLPQEKWNNLNALMALYKKTENCEVFSVQVSRPGMEQSRSYILEQIEFVLENSAKKDGGVKFIAFLSNLDAFIPTQLCSTTMAMVGGTLVTGVSEMASSPSEILLIST